MSARFHVEHATAQPLLDRLDGLQKTGNGWRARCPACGGRSQKLSIAERDGKVLIHDFGGCSASEVLAAVGLNWADIMPPRDRPESPEERRQARKAIREAGWSAALRTLALESKIVLLAARVYAPLNLLPEDDQARLGQALERIEHAANVLCEPETWRPPHES